MSLGIVVLHRQRFWIYNHLSLAWLLFHPIKLFRICLPFKFLGQVLCAFPPCCTLGSFMRMSFCSVKSPWSHCHTFHWTLGPWAHPLATELELSRAFLAHALVFYIPAWLLASQVSIHVFKLMFLLSHIVFLDADSIRNRAFSLPCKVLVIDDVTFASSPKIC